MMEKERFHYIDVSKGLLMILVVYAHLCGFGAVKDNTVIIGIRYSVNTFLSFYMPCFFVITGICSNFRKPFKSFIVGNIKSLILPSFVISLSFSCLEIVLWVGGE